MQSGIIIKKVSFQYDNGKFALSNFNLTIKNGTFLGITGVNGSGKSTFCYLLNGLIPHHLKGNFKGDVIIDGISTKSYKTHDLAKKIGLVFQNPDFSLFNLTVEEEIIFGLDNLHIEKKGERVNDSLNLVGLKGYKKRDPQTLSFGEKQKVALACVLALDTPYIVLDEPTAQLDFKSSLELYKILAKLNSLGKTVITVDHDTDFLFSFTRETLILNKGQVLDYGKTEKVFSKRKILRDLGIKIPNSNPLI